MTFFERLRKWLMASNDPKQRSLRIEQKKAKEMADFLERNKQAKEKEGKRYHRSP